MHIKFVLDFILQDHYKF